MFESDDWIFENILDDVGGNEEETRKKSYSPCQNKEKIPSVKRRKVDSREAPLTHNTLVQKSESDTVVNIEDNGLSSKDKNDVSRGDLLLGIFQKNTCQETFNFTKDVEKDHPLEMEQTETQCFHAETVAASEVIQRKEYRGKSDESTTRQVRFDKEVKLIRLFPGPAGLILDVKNDNISTASYLRSVEKLKNKTSTNRIEIKSQDENNSYGGIAWKLLLNDLPSNFLQDYKISNVKDKANASHCDSTRVKFIAGVLDYVDHSHDDPFVVLKDSTGSIEGTIHRDVPSTYPGILEPNVVVFLRDVGLLKTITYVVTSKYHMLVSLVNLLAVYSDKGRIVSTPLMEDIVSRASNGESNRIDDRTPISMEPVYISGLRETNEGRKALLQTSSSIEDHELMKNLSLHPTNRKSRGEIYKNDKNCKVTNETLEYLDRSMDTKDTNVFFTTECDFTRDQDRFNRSLSKNILQTNKIQRCDLQQVQDRKYLENTKKKSTIIYREQTEERDSSKTLKKRTDVKTRDVHYSRENCFSSRNDAAIRKDSNRNAKVTLPTIKRNAENSRTLVSYFRDDKRDAYDSDDEILSQLDVDNIVDERKKNC